MLLISASYRKVRHCLKRYVFRRIVGVVLLITIAGMGLFALRNFPPIIPIDGDSMYPTLRRNDLIRIKRVDPKAIQKGDIIIVRVPSFARKSHNYPPLIAHRVNGILTDGQRLVFRTAGDNTGADPFAVRPSDLVGRMGFHIPYIGFVVLLLQSKFGVWSVVGIVAILITASYEKEIKQFRKEASRKVFAPILEEQERLRIRSEETLEIIHEYGKQLAGHTHIVAEVGTAAKNLNDAVYSFRQAVIEFQKAIKKEEDSKN